MATATTRRPDVADAIRAMVVNRVFRPGDRLGEADIAARLDVSRTPVREALRQLAADGLVELAPNKGARVVSMDGDELEHLFALRAQVEGTAARRAAATVTNAELDVMSDLADTISLHGLPGPAQDLGRVYGCNASFHLAVAEATRSSIVAGSVRQLFHAAATVRTYQGFDEPSIRRSVAHHHELVAALRMRDGDWAQAVMHSHIANARAALLGPFEVSRANAAPSSATDTGDVLDESLATPEVDR